MSKIPIKNIYYMLCYAWDILPQSGEKLIGSESFENIYDLLSKILINGVNNLLKRGFHREYIDYSEESSLIHGKIDVASSIKRQTMLKGKMICCFDEFSYDVGFNQIIKATITSLIKYPKLDKNFKTELVSLRRYFADIKDIEITNSCFSSLRFNRNNMHYKLLMNICKLIHDGLISNENSNLLKFSDFLQEKQMEKLYEKFVLNFYKKHLDMKRYKVHSPQIEWAYDKDFMQMGKQYMPTMQTDIVVENKLDKIQQIIDTKYYANALVSKSDYSAQKHITHNLYQIFTYVNNSKYAGEITGMLLYPTTTQELDCEYSVGGKLISVKTLNLDTEWNVIESRLLKFVK